MLNKFTAITILVMIICLPSLLIGMNLHIDDKYKILTRILLTIGIIGIGGYLGFCFGAIIVTCINVLLK